MSSKFIRVQNYIISIDEILAVWRFEDITKIQTRSMTNLYHIISYDGDLKTCEADFEEISTAILNFKNA